MVTAAPCSQGAPLGGLIWQVRENAWYLQDIALLVCQASEVTDLMEKFYGEAGPPATNVFGTGEDPGNMAKTGEQI